MKKLLFILALLSSTTAFAVPSKLRTLPEIAVAGASVTVGYTTVYSNAGKLGIKSCSINNLTDQNITLGDGTNPLFSGLRPNSFIVFDWITDEAFMDGAIALKYTTTQPTTGFVYIDCFY